jgi:activator of HSP90 ATPase
MNNLARGRSPTTCRIVVAGLAVTLGSVTMPGAAGFAASESVSHTQEAIHQEVVLHATPQRVYAALTDVAQFQKVILLSAAVTSGMVKPPATAQLSREVGSAFSLFGGAITGRIIELVPNVRIVQAWRTADWPAGVYSLARFELSASGANTRVTFDHTGFPIGASSHLAAGWKGNYWEPLEKMLSAATSKP